MKNFQTATPPARDFTLQQYTALCEAITQSGYNSLTISDYLRAEDHSLPEKMMLLRHDVDSRPQHAPKLAAIEQAHNLRATYYFRTIPGVFNAGAMRCIVEMGHEVGYHYETLGQARGDMAKAIDLFRQELARMREVVPVTSASMHGSPLKPWDNRDIWQHTMPADFDLLGEAYRDIDYNEVVYLNDSGRTWHPTRYNLRDYTTVPQKIEIDTTAELIDLLRDGNLRWVCLSAHPERWQDGRMAWTMQSARDVVINWTKAAIKRLRG